MTLWLKLDVYGKLIEAKKLKLQFKATNKIIR